MERLVFRFRLSWQILIERWKVQHLLVNTVKGKAFALVSHAEKCHDIATWNRIKSEFECDAAGRNTAMLM